MRILHLSSSDIDGGAALGAYWLHEELCAQGHDSLMLVQNKRSDDARVIPSRSVVHFMGRLLSARIIVERIAQKFLRIFCRGRGRGLISPQIWAPSGLVDEINVLRPDIVHIHWAQAGFLMPEDIARIDAPIVWTARDMWPVTHGEHYIDDADLTGVEHKKSWLWRRKQKAFAAKSDITFVAISDWLLDILRSSPLLQNHESICIHNGVPGDVFHSLDDDARADLYAQLGLDSDKRYILFGAMQSTTDTRKGFHHVQDIVRDSKTPDDVHFLIFGAQKGDGVDLDIDDARCRYLGYLTREQLAQYYQISDVTLVPSEQEAFGKVAAESIMCGTPVVCFDVGGLKDIVTHQENGWRAPCFDSRDLSVGILWCLDHHVKRKMLNATYDFSAKTMTVKYITLYQRLINKTA